MLSQPEQAMLNLEQARDLRAAGCAYREIGKRLGLTSNQLGHIRRTLKRQKAASTRLRTRQPDATDRDLPVAQSVLPPGLRKLLKSLGYATLGALADRIADPDLPALVTLNGIGPHRMQLIRRMLDHYDLLAGSDDLQSEIEQLFPEFGGMDPDPA
jgi:hypothetical protein